MTNTAMNEKWYVLSVRSRHEKKVAEQLAQCGIDAYVPLIKTLRQWSDRKKWVEMPVITCYVFVKMDYTRRDITYDIPGIVRFVTFRGEPATLSEQEIKNMKILADNAPQIELEQQQYYPGQTITIEKGPFAGFTGTVVKIKNRNYLIVSLDFMGLILKAEISSKYLNISSANS